MRSSENIKDYSRLGRGADAGGVEALRQRDSLLTAAELGFKPVRILRLHRPWVPTDPLHRAIAQHLFEHQGTKFAHLPASLRPRLDRASDERWVPSAQSNPFQRPERPSALTSEVVSLYNAMAFAMWQYGSVMNTHLIICWKLLGVTNHAKAVERLSLYNKQAAKWLGVGIGDGAIRSRVSRRVSDRAVPHLYVYVHENAQEKGFHSHELMNVPPGRAQEFVTWSRAYLGQLCGRSDVDERAVFFSPASKVLKQFKPYEGKRESFAVERQWDWFKYITKSLHPDHMERSAVGAGWRQGRDIFGIDRPFMNTPPVRCRKLAGWSEKLGEAAQKRSGFVSKFKSGNWSSLYDGSELDEFRAYMVQVEEEIRDEAGRAEMQAMLQHIRI